MSYLNWPEDPARESDAQRRARGDGDVQARVVAAVLWFAVTVAIGGVVASASGVGGSTADLAEVNWWAVGGVALVWVAVLNVPVWALAWWRLRGRR